MADCGYTPDQVAELCLLDVWMFFEFQRRHVPLRDLVQAIAQAIGIEIPDHKPKQYMTGDALRQLVDRTGGRMEGLSDGR